MTTPNAPPSGVPVSTAEHDSPIGASKESIKAGHEPDAFAVKPILSVPLAVVLTFLVAFGVAAGVFAYVMAPEPANPFAHPEAVKRGSAPLNERLERIDRRGANDDPRREVDQPRLEPLRKLEDNGQFYARIEMPTGNSPQIHPEEIRPDRVAALHEYGYSDGEKKMAVIPIDEAMKLATEGKLKLDGQPIVPVRASQSKSVPRFDRAAGQNAGRGEPPITPKEQAAPSKEPGKIEPPKAPEMPKAPEKK